MHMSAYVCLAALTAAQSGCFWATCDGYRGDRNGGMAVAMKTRGIGTHLRRPHESFTAPQRLGAHESGQREGWYVH
jgi:hypothetical protein